jgi:hypothetical protein
MAGTPQFNRMDTIVTEIRGGLGVDIHTQKITNCCRYACDIMPPEHNGKPVYWAEMSLRKKPKPSDYSFDELIREINDTVVV